MNFALLVPLFLDGGFVRIKQAKPGAAGRMKEETR